MSSNRVITAAVVGGITISVITIIGVSRLSGDEKPTRSSPSLLTPVKAGSHGVVVFGNVDVDAGAGLLHIFPENFPQPSLVKEVRVSEGADVQVGDTLVVFDSDLVEFKVREAEAGLARALAAQRGAEAKLKQANDAENAKGLALAAQQLIVKARREELEAARVELNDKKSRLNKIDPQVMDPEIVAATRKLEAKENEIKGEELKMEGIIKYSPLANKSPEAQAGIEEAKQAVALQKVLLDEALFAKKQLTLKARVAGRIVRSYVSVGSTYGPQSRLPLFYLQPKGPMIVRMEVDQEFASRVMKGQDASISDDGNPNLKWTGKVLRVADSFLPKRSSSSEAFMMNDTRVLEGIVSIETHGSPIPIRIGQRVKVSIGVE